MRLAALAIASVLLGAAAPAAAAKTEAAESGAIRAELSYASHKHGKPPTNLVLRVFDAGTKIVEERIPDDRSLSPVGYDNALARSVSARDLDGDGVAEAVFDLYTGGAHCCELTYLYKGSKLIKKDWGNFGYQFEDFDGDGLAEFHTADDHFAYRYGSYAASIEPLKVLRLVDGELSDLTRDASVKPALRTEARELRHVYRHYRRKVRRRPVLEEIVRSALAAHAADQCSLGHCAAGYALVRKAQRRGDLPKTRGFAKRVRSDMRRFGYDT